MAQPEGGPDRPVIVMCLDPTRGPVPAQQLASRYGTDYEVIAEASADEAIGRLRQLAERCRDVAVVLAPRAERELAVLRAARVLHPHARRGLLVGFGEHRAAREQVVPILEVGLAEQVVVGPLGIPGERFHRDVLELLHEWWRQQGRPGEGVRVVGDPQSARTHEACDLLERHDFPYGFYPARSEQGRSILAELGVDGR